MSQEAWSGNAPAGAPSSREEERAGPTNPLEISGEGWKATLARVKRRITRDRVSVSAGSLAYHGFLAFFPAIIAGLGVLSLVHVGASTLHHLTHGLAKAFPPGASGVFNGAVRAATSHAQTSLAAAVVGILVAIWSTSSAMAVLQQTLDVAYEVRVDRKFLARRIRALPMLALTAVLGGSGASMIIFGQPIGSALRGVVPISGIAFEIGWTVLRWVLALVLITVLFGALYYLGTNRDQPRWQWFTPGSLVATAVFVAGSLGFSFYISTFGHYGKTYGSFAGVAIFIFWLYLMGMGVLVGGELNAELERAATREGAEGSWDLIGRWRSARRHGGAPLQARAGQQSASPQASEPRRASG